ncbi:MAG: hypothetical protein RL701_267, partial [Pseudomonadota bacterium]
RPGRNTMLLEAAAQVAPRVRVAAVVLVEQAVLQVRVAPAASPHPNHGVVMAL